MTFCIGILVRDGLVALADTQVVRSEEVSNKAKLSLLRHDGHDIVLMTSGLRSVRDKAALRLQDRLDALDQPLTHLHEIATAWGDQLKEIRTEDGPSIQASGLTFNSHALLAGRLSADDQPGLFLVYPEGNWVHATEDTPSFVIGRSSYGKPIIDRLLGFDTTLSQAAALAYLAFDATRASVTDVDFPIDVVLMEADGLVRRHRYEREDLEHAHASWQASLRDALMRMPMDWTVPLTSPGIATNLPLDGTVPRDHGSPDSSA